MDLHPRGQKTCFFYSFFFNESYLFKCSEPKRWKFFRIPTNKESCQVHIDYINVYNVQVWLFVWIEGVLNW